MQASAPPGLAVTYSKDSAASGRPRPASASASQPSTSSFTNAGSPKRSMSWSSVVTATTPAGRQSRPAKPGSRLTSSIQQDDNVVTVRLVGAS
jgi:hypothetical protein